MSSANQRAVFLDRDGVLNRAVVREGRPYPATTLDEVEILPGVVDGVRQLKAAGFVLIVVSNQPDVARGILPRASVEAINEYLSERLPIDRFIMCYHDNGDNCDCRKPRPGMLLTGGREFNVDLSASFMVGDRWRDIEAGASAGCRTFFIDYGYDERRPLSSDFRVSSLQEAALIIISETNNEKH
jgi:D-glycero-D-manno-heptose 1,7-bisphosphate phosphatase